MTILLKPVKKSSRAGLLRVFPVSPSKGLQQEMWRLCDERKKILSCVRLIDNKLINFVGIMWAMLRLSVVSSLICFQIAEFF